MKKKEIILMLGELQNKIIGNKKKLFKNDNQDIIDYIENIKYKVDDLLIRVPGESPPKGYRYISNEEFWSKPH